MATTKKKPAKRTQPEKPAEPRGKLVDMKIEHLRFDDKLQGRDPEEDKLKRGELGFWISPQHVEDVRGAIKAGTKLPQPRVWAVAGKGNYVTDGHHEIEAYYLEGRKVIEVRLFEGSFEDAMLDAGAANQHEGAPLKRTQADRRRAVVLTLQALAEKGENWTDSRIAGHVGVGNDLVKRVRISSGIKIEGKKTGKDGKAYADPPAGSGKKTGAPASPPPPPAPQSPPPGPNTSPKPPAAKPPTPKELAAGERQKFEAEYGKLFRTFDEGARVMEVNQTPRTVGIRKLFGELLTEYTAWLEEATARKEKALK